MGWGFDNYLLTPLTSGYKKELDIVSLVGEEAGAEPGKWKMSGEGLHLFSDITVAS